ncbi:MAG: helix-turn-helix domain-containing protein [Alphaproteobacteria bacterium]|nr:helix-turn-helix domain-containing protein [Alphaproteobacteria bacterium]
MTVETANGQAGMLGKQRRGSPVGQDLRGRAVAAVLEGGMSAAAAARRFGLSESAVRNWVRRFRKRGHVRPDPMGGGVSRIEPERERIFRILEARPRLTIRGLCAALAAEGLFFGSSTVHRFLKRHGLERDRRLARSRRKRRWTER